MSILMMRQVICDHDRRALVIVLLLVLAIAAWQPIDAQAAGSIVTKIWSNEIAAETRVAIVTTQPVRYQLRTLRPDWIVIDIPAAKLGIPAGQLPPVGGFVKKLRVGQFTSDTVRVVVELVQAVDFHLNSLNNNSTILVRIPVDTSAHHDATHAQVISQPASVQASEIRIIPPQTQGGQTQPIPLKGSGTAQHKINTVIGGQAIGPVKLGMTVKDFSVITGPSTSTERMSDGTTVYRWFAPPRNVGVGVRVTPAGSAYRIWVLNDPGYVTKGGLRVGSTDAEVRTALGEPSKVLLNAQVKIKTLVYDALGLWFGIQLDERYSFYNSVFEIGVMQPKERQAQ